MEIKKLTEKDFEESLRLSMYAFQYQIPEDKKEKRMEKFKRQNVFGIWEESELAAKLHIIPFRIHLNEQTWDMGGIAGVATYPEYRRKGYVRHLLNKALATMYEENQSVSLLHPFDIGFYRKFGWEIISEYKKVELKKSDLLPLNSVEGVIRRFNRDSHNDGIEAVYRQFSSRFNGMLVRDLEWWKDNVYDEAQIAVFYSENSDPEGYLLYTIKDHFMDIQEMVSISHNAKIGLWNFICQHDSMVDKVNIVLPPNDTIAYYLKNPKIKTELIPYFMGRIVDAEAVLKKYKFGQSSQSVFIHLTDENAHWNTGSYHLQQENVAVYKQKKGSLCTHPPKRGLNLSINVLSAILFGYQRPLEMYESGMINGLREEVQVLEELIPLTKPFFYDFF